MRNDKAGSVYWDERWHGTEVPPAVNPRAPGLNNYVNRCVHRFLRQAFRDARAARGSSVLEFGCAASAWLPYFAIEYGFKPYGIDYSAPGCAQALAILQNSGVAGEVTCADLFEPPPRMLQRFDIAVSFGVVEHYRRTADCIGVFSRYLRPGGLMITLIPNMRGLPGFLQKLLDREVYSIHVPLSRDQLAQAHAEAGLQVLRTQYLMSLNLNVVNIDGWTDRAVLKHGVTRLRSWLSKAVWATEQAVGNLPRTAMLSPYIACVARKP